MDRTLAARDQLVVQSLLPQLYFTTLGVPRNAGRGAINPNACRDGPRSLAAEGAADIASSRGFRRGSQASYS
jgi:hypothetical protein